MIAADTSSVIGYLNGASGRLMDLLEQSMQAQTLFLPPPVITELRTGETDPQLDQILNDAPMLSITDGFWDRAGQARRILRRRGLKAKAVDALVAQCCIDADTPLITLDNDFRHFVEFGLRLA